MNIKEFVAGLVAVVIGIYVMAMILPLAITEIQDVNTTAWTFEGHVGAATIWELSAFMLVIGGFLVVVAWAFSSFRANKTAMSPMPTLWLDRLLQKLGRKC
jgi:hypothetical protein